MILSHDKYGRHYEEGEVVFKEGSSPYIYHSQDYVERKRLGILTEKEEREAKERTDSGLESWYSRNRIEK